MNKINSALFENILPQEVDFAINANIQRFAKQRYGAHANLKQKGFEMSQKRIDDLRTLVVPNYTDRSYLPDTIDPDYTQKVISFFPADYMLSVASRFRVAYDECDSITPTTSTETINVTLLNFDTLKANGLVDWTNFQLWLTNPNPGTAVKVLDLETAGANYALTEDFTYVIRIILQKLRTAYPTTYEFYWENYKGSYYKNTIVIVNKTGNAELWGVVANTLAYDVNPTTITKMYYSNSVTLTTSGKAVQQDDIFAMQADPFNKTVADFPLYYTSGYQYNTYIDVNE